MKRRRKFPHVYAIVLLVGIAFAVVLTLESGLPAALPGVALGSNALLHVERAVAILLAIFLVFVVVARAWDGEIPDQISKDGIKYQQVGREVVDDAVDAAGSPSAPSPDKDPADDSIPEDLLALRLKLEAKMSYIARTILASEKCACGVFVTIGSLNHDGFLSDKEARTATQVLTLRDEELDTLAPRLRWDFMRNANTVVGNIRASVFYGLVRESFKKNKWEVREIPVAKGRPDLLVCKGEQRYRIVPRFVLKKESNILERAKRRLAEGKDDESAAPAIVVLPDLARGEIDADGDPLVIRFTELREQFKLSKDPRVRD